MKMQMIGIMLVSLVATLVAIPVLAKFADRLGLIDKPDARKQHQGHIPLVGGLGVMVGLVVANLLGALNGIGWSFWLGAAAIFSLGLLDDRLALNARLRFFLQWLICLVALASAGVELSSLGQLLGQGTRLRLGVFALPLTAFAIVGVINAFNMSDGLDGLAGGLALISCALMFVCGLMGASYFGGVAAPVLVAMMGALTGFLFFNLRTPIRKKASVFMGDAGSTTLGFMLGWMAVAAVQGHQESKGILQGPFPVTMLWLVAMPLLDTVVTMLRRMRWRSSPFKADREHLHHLFVRAGLQIEQAVFCIHGLALLVGVVGIATWSAGVAEWHVFLMFLGVFLTHFSLVKFLAFRARVREGTLKRIRPDASAPNGAELQTAPLR